MEPTSPPARTTTVIIVAALIALLLGCCGLLIGGAAGFLLGRAGATAPDVQTFEFPDERALPAIPDLPAIPELPATPSMTGAHVREVITASPAEAAGLGVDDLIIAVDDVPVDRNHRLATLISRYQPGDRITLTVLRDSEELTLRVILGQSDDGGPYLGIRYEDMIVEDSAPAD